MTSESPGAATASASPDMSAERWRAIDAILQAVLACEPERRPEFVAQACGDDHGMLREVESLLAACAADDFLERPAVAELGVVAVATPPAVRLAAALQDRYDIERELGRGGMATVHLAIDRRHHRRVAIKVLRDELAAAVGAERFLKEIEVTAALQHPHILPLFDSGSAGGLLYYVMPCVEGETLRERLMRDGMLPVDEALRLAREIAGALEHAHRHGVVHRDIKPENVLLQDGHALVGDFGIALALEQAGGERITRTGLTLGTPQYMAPEQAAGERTIDARADVYAMGAVLHEMLAGESPFAAPTAQAVISRVLTEAPTALRSRRPGVPPHVDAAVRRALAKRPADRFPSAAAFAAALTEPAAPERTPAAGAVRRRTVSVRTTAILVLTALVVGLVGGWAMAASPIARGWDAPDAVRPALEAAARDVFPNPGDLALTVVDRAGRAQMGLPARRPWTPRFSPDGRRIAYGAFGTDRGTSDVWVSDLVAGTTRRLTDDDADGNDAQWSPDGARIAFSVKAPSGKDVVVQRVDSGAPGPFLRRGGNQFPSDWVRDGSAVLMTDEARGNQDVWVQPLDGSPARPYAATGAAERAARVSPDGRWVAYTSDESGRDEVYVDSYPTPGRRVLVSTEGGFHPVWRGDSRELYYWQGDQLVAAAVDASGARVQVQSRTPLFRASYQPAINAMYDVSPDGTRFVIVGER